MYLFMSMIESKNQYCNKQYDYSIYSIKVHFAVREHCLVFSSHTFLIT